MQFALALVCVVAAPLIFVSGHPAGATAGERSVAQLQDEFNSIGAQLRADLKTALARSDWKTDSHVQAALNGIGEADKVMVQMVKGITDSKNPITESEAERLANNLKNLGKKIGSEVKQMRPEHLQDPLFRQIGTNFAKEALLLAQIALKQESNAAKKFGGVKEALTFQ